MTASASALRGLGCAVALHQRAEVGFRTEQDRSQGAEHLPELPLDPLQLALVLQPVDGCDRLVPRGPCTQREEDSN